MTTINMNPFQLPCSIFDFTARTGVVNATDTSLAGDRGVPKSQRSKVRMRKVLNTFIFHLKSVSNRECMRVEYLPYIFCYWQLQFLLQAFQITQNRVA